MTINISSLSNSILLAGLFASNVGFSFSKTLISALASLSPDLAFFSKRPIRFSTVSKSAMINSKLIVSISLIGSTSPSTCVTSLSLKHLTTSQIASVSLIFPKNLFPKPSPLLAPLTSPAISVNSKVVGTVFLGSIISVNLSKR